MNEHNDHIKRETESVATGTKVWIGFTVIGILLLFFFHGTHVFNYLPYLLLLACPLLHLFMHSGHGDHNDKQQSDQKNQSHH